MEAESAEQGLLLASEEFPAVAFCDINLPRGQSGFWLVEQLHRLPGIVSDPVSGQAEIDPERHQPLLRAIVEVPFEPAAFRVAGVDDPRARGSEFVDVRPQLGIEPFVLERQRRGGPDGLHQFGLGR